MIAQPHTYKRIPISREALADLDTPLSVYLKLAQGPYSYLLESAEGGEKWGRYSIIGLPARTIISVSGSHIEVKTDGEVVEALDSEDPLTFIEDFLDRFKVEGCDAMPRFFGGLVGYFGYDTVRYVERRLAHSTPPDKLNTPDILLMVSEDVVVFDNLEGRMQLISLIDPDDPVLIMSVNPGFGGQAFIPQSLEKLVEARALIDSSGRPIRLQIDGGIKIDNISDAARAGADSFVAGTAIFNTDDYAQTIGALRDAIATTS